MKITNILKTNKQIKSPLIKHTICLNKVTYIDPSINFTCCEIISFDAIQTFSCKKET